MRSRSPARRRGASYDDRQPDYDVLVIGAGLSGIGVAYHLKTQLPGKSFALLERRAALGGTWDFGQYPGFRNDSTMFTYAYGFHPWAKNEHIVSGEQLLAYLHEVVDTHGLREHVQCGKSVEAADFSHRTALWTLQLADGSTLRCSYLVCASGYYDYTAGHMPEFKGRSRFAGEVVHAQQWERDKHTYAGKRVAIIGSGATAITIMPVVAAEGGATAVTVVQRSLSDVQPMHAVDPDTWLHRLLVRVRGAASAYYLKRVYYLVSGYLFYWLCKLYPRRMRRFFEAQTRFWTPTAFEPHFNPTYNPWEQRLCVSPRADFFKALAKPHVSMATGAIDTFTKNGVRLEGGEHVDADLVIICTGFNLLPLGGVRVSIDGAPMDLSVRMLYKGFQPEGVPNLAVVIGYLNASWTLRVDLIGRYITRLIKHMDEQKASTSGQRNASTSGPRNARVCTPLADPHAPRGREPLFDFKSSFLERSRRALPEQGLTWPWRLRQNYFLEWVDFHLRSIDDGYMTFTPPGAKAVYSGGGARRALPQVMLLLAAAAAAAATSWVTTATVLTAVSTFLAAQIAVRMVLRSMPNHVTAVRVVKDPSWQDPSWPRWAATVKAGGRWKSGWRTAPDGQRLFWNEFLPPGRPLGVLLFAHGANEHSGRYNATLQQICVELNVAAYSMDHRGHGRSRDDPTLGSPGCYFESLDTLTDDWVAFRAFALGRASSAAGGATELPLFVIGFSFGCMVHLHVGLKHPEIPPPRGIVLIAPFIDIPRTLPIRLLTLVVRPLAFLCPRAKLVPAVEADMVTRNPELIEALRLDPQVSHRP